MKNNILASLILVMSFIIIGISGSYAFFINSIEEVHPENKGLSVTSGDLTMNFVDEKSKYINASGVGLIKDDEVTNGTNTDYATFAVTLPSSSNVKSASYELYLTNINMSCNFKSTDLKWALYNDGDSALGSEVARGDFSNLTSEQCPTAGTSNTSTSAFSNLVLKSDETINNGATKAYRLYVWLSYSTSKNQTELLNGSLTANLAFRATSNNQ